MDYVPVLQAVVTDPLRIAFATSCRDLKTGMTESLIRLHTVELAAHSIDVRSNMAKGYGNKDSEISAIATEMSQTPGTRGKAYFKGASSFILFIFPTSKSLAMIGT